MMQMKQIAAAALVGLMVAVPAGGDDSGKNADTDTAEVNEKLEKALKKFARTGEMKRCLNPSRIRSSHVVDDNHIIFEITSKTRYLSTLPKRCHSLGFHRAITYTVRGGSICKRDLFRVLDQFSFPGPTCSFGEFERLELKKDKDKETATD